MDSSRISAAFAVSASISVSGFFVHEPCDHLQCVSQRLKEVTRDNQIVGFLVVGRASKRGG